MNLLPERIARTVWVLGGVSLFMDMLSELVHAVLPVYLITVLGVSVLAEGIFQGIAKATASMLKVVPVSYPAARLQSFRPHAAGGHGPLFRRPLLHMRERAHNMRRQRGERRRA